MKQKLQTVSGKRSVPQYSNAAYSLLTQILKEGNRSDGKAAEAI